MTHQRRPDVGNRPRLHCERAKRVAEVMEADRYRLLPQISPGPPDRARHKSAAGVPLLVAIILCATSLGVLIPVLKDAGEISSTLAGIGSTLLLIGSLVVLGVVVFLAANGAERSMTIRSDL